MIATLEATPYYVLMEGKLCIGPSVMEVQTKSEYTPIYAFSAKDTYDVFCEKSTLELRPYPLVKDYLRTRVEAPKGGLTLVILDAAGPAEPCVHAATTEAVLEAHEKRKSRLTATHRLLFDQTTNGYRVEEVRA